MRKKSTPPQPSVYIADDDSDDVYFVRSAFDQVGLDVKLEHFMNGRELMEALQLQKDLPNLVFLDLNMPVMDGKEALRLIRGDNRLHDIPVVILSTSSQKNEQENCMTCGAAGYFVKPFSFNRYLEIVRQVKELYIAADERRVS
jgi:CheY-like chemotaxis protein